MRVLVPVLVALFVIACGDPGTNQDVAADESSAGGIDFCTCVNEPLNTDARLKACNDLMSTLTPEQNATKAIECREALPVPDGGPDLCYCLRTTTRDEEILAACEALIPDDMTPKELTRTIAGCAR